MIVTTAIVVSAAASAYGAYSSAEAQKKAAEAASKSRTTTSSAKPYMSDSLAPYLTDILGQQKGLFDSYHGGGASAPAAGSAPAPDASGPIAESHHAPAMIGRWRPHANPALAPDPMQAAQDAAENTLKHPAVAAQLGQTLGVGGQQPSVQPEVAAGGSGLRAFSDLNTFSPKRAPQLPYGYY